MHSSFFKIASATLLTIIVLIPIWPPVLWSLTVVVPLALVGIYDLFQTGHAIRRNFPLFGRGRWIMEALRPSVRGTQYDRSGDRSGGQPIRTDQGDTIPIRTDQRSEGHNIH